MIKQHNESALNFALAGIMSFIIAMILLFFLWQNITTEKQMTELQTTGQRLAKVVASQAFAEGDEKSFAEFAQLVKSFNQQWDDLKQLQNNLSVEKIKEIDEIKDQLNTNAPKWLALQEDIVAQTLAKKELYSNTQKMRQMNDELLNMLLRANADKQQILTIQQISLNLSQSEIIYKEQLDGLGAGGIFHPEDVWRPVTDIDDLLEAFLHGNSDEGVAKIDNLIARKTLEHEANLYKKNNQLINLFYKNVPEIYEHKGNLFYHANRLSQKLLLLNEKIVDNVFAYLASIIFVGVCILFFTTMRSNAINFFISILLLTAITIVFINENLKKSDFFDRVNKMKFSKNYMDEIIDKIDGRNLKDIDFSKIKHIFNELSKKWHELEKIHTNNVDEVIALDYIFEDFKIKEEIIGKNKKEFIDLSSKSDKIIESILYVQEALFLYDDIITVNKYSIEDLLMMKELLQRLYTIKSYFDFAYYSNHKAILNESIDLTLSDYIAILRKNPNMVNADYSIDPEIQNKIKILNTEIEAFKVSFRAALAVKEAVLAIRDKNLELNATLTHMYNQQIIKELMIMTLYSWLCVFFCAYGYVRAIKAEKK